MIAGVIHFVPTTDLPADGYGEALARLAGLKRALSLIENQPGEMAERAYAAQCAWTEADEARRRRFAVLTEREALAAAAGLDALLANPAAEPARRVLAEEMAKRLDELARLLRS